MIRFILLIAVLPFLIVGVLAQGRQLQYRETLVDTSPVSWPSSSPQYMQTTTPVVVDLWVSKTDLPDPATQSSPLTYTITITNNGPGDATGVVLADALPLTIEFGSAQPSQGSCSQTTFVVTCNLNNLTKFATATVSIVVTPTQVGTIINTVAVDSTGSEDFNDENNTATATTFVKAPSPTPGSNIYYLPIIFKNFTAAPDLVVDNLIATRSAVTVTIRNAGAAPVVDAFWVDAYFNPRERPSLNHTWQMIAPAGAAWGVRRFLAPGESLTLTSGGDYYYPNYSSRPPFPARATVYAFVDAVNYKTTYGAVLESNEHNNLSKPVISRAGESESQTIPLTQTPSLAGLPKR